MHCLRQETNKNRVDTSADLSLSDLARVHVVEIIDGGKPCHKNVDTKVSLVPKLDIFLICRWKGNMTFPESIAQGTSSIVGM